MDNAKNALAIKEKELNETKEILNNVVGHFLNITHKVSENKDVIKTKLSEDADKVNAFKDILQLLNDGKQGDGDMAKIKGAFIKFAQFTESFTDNNELSNASDYLNQVVNFIDDSISTDLSIYNKDFGGFIGFITSFFEELINSQKIKEDLAGVKDTFVNVAEEISRNKVAIEAKLRLFGTNISELKSIAELFRQGNSTQDMTKITGAFGRFIKFTGSGTDKIHFNSTIQKLNDIFNGIDKVTGYNEDFKKLINFIANFFDSLVSDAEHAETFKKVEESLDFLMKEFSNHEAALTTVLSDITKRSDLEAVISNLETGLSSNDIDIMETALKGFANLLTFINPDIWGAQITALNTGLNSLKGTTGYNGSVRTFINFIKDFLNRGIEAGENRERLKNTQDAFIGIIKIFTDGDDLNTCLDSGTGNITELEEVIVKLNESITPPESIDTTKTALEMLGSAFGLGILVDWKDHMQVLQENSNFLNGLALDEYPIPIKDFVIFIKKFLEEAVLRKKTQLEKAETDASLAKTTDYFTGTKNAFLNVMTDIYAGKDYLKTALDTPANKTELEEIIARFENGVTDGNRDTSKDALKRLMVLLATTGDADVLSDEYIDNLHKGLNLLDGGVDADYNAQVNKFINFIVSLLKEITENKELKKIVDDQKDKLTKVESAFNDLLGNFNDYKDKLKTNFSDVNKRQKLEDILVDINKSLADDDMTSGKAALSKFASDFESGNGFAEALKNLQEGFDAMDESDDKYKNLLKIFLNLTKGVLEDIKELEKEKEKREAAEKELARFKEATCEKLLSMDTLILEIQKMALECVGKLDTEEKKRDAKAKFAAIFDYTSEADAINKMKDAATLVPTTPTVIPTVSSTTPEGKMSDGLDKFLENNDKGALKKVFKENLKTSKDYDKVLEKVETLISDKESGDSDGIEEQVGFILEKMTDRFLKQTDGPFRKKFMFIDKVAKKTNFGAKVRKDIANKLIVAHAKNNQSKLIDPNTGGKIEDDKLRTVLAKFKFLSPEALSKKLKKIKKNPDDLTKYDAELKMDYAAITRGDPTWIDDVKDPDYEDALSVISEHGDDGEKKDFLDVLLKSFLINSSTSHTDISSFMEKIKAQYVLLGKENDFAEKAEVSLRRRSGRDNFKRAILTYMIEFTKTSGMSDDQRKANLELYGEFYKNRLKYPSGVTILWPILPMTPTLAESIAWIDQIKGLADVNNIKVDSEYWTKSITDKNGYMTALNDILGGTDEPKKREDMQALIFNLTENNTLSLVEFNLVFSRIIEKSDGIMEFKDFSDYAINFASNKHDVTVAVVENLTNTLFATGSTIVDKEDRVQNYFDTLKGITTYSGFPIWKTIPATGDPENTWKIWVRELITEAENNL